MLPVALHLPKREMSGCVEYLKYTGRAFGQRKALKPVASRLFMVAGEGFAPPDLRVMSSKNVVLYRVTSSKKALKTLAFLNSSFGIVL